MSGGTYISYGLGGGSGGGIPTYANFAAFPVASSTALGSLAIALDTGILYENIANVWTVVASPGAAFSLGNLDAQSATAKGAALVSGVLSMQSADSTHPGLINTLTQSFGGNKTFTGTVGASNLSGTNTGDVTLSTANGLSLVGQALSLGLSSTSTTGALSSTDWNTFNNKQSTLTLGNLTDAGTDGITITGGTGAVIGSGTSISQHVADSTHNGYLSSTDWSTFNGKQSTLTLGNLTESTSNVLTITGGTGAIIGSGLTIQVASAGAASAGVVTTGTQTFAGTKTFSSTISGSINGNAATVTTNANLTGDVTSVGNATTYNNTVPINKGGTGQTSASAAFNSLSPITTTGDLILGNGVNSATRLGIGTNTQVLTSNGTTASWQTPSTGFTNPMTTLGDTMYEDATPVAARLAGNTTTTKKFLTQTGNGTISAAPGWNTIASADLPTITLTGNVTGAASGGSIATTIGSSVVTNTMLAGSIDLTTKVTGTLPIANGGTNNGSLAVTAGGLTYTDGTKLVNTGAGTAGQFMMSNGSSAPTFQTPKTPLVTTLLGSDKTNYWGTWTITAGSATIGAVYTNNGQSHTVSTSINGRTTLLTKSTSNATSGSTLTKSSGTGDATLTFSATSFATSEPSGTFPLYDATVAYIRVRMIGPGGGGGGGGSSAGSAGAAGGNSTFGSSLLTASGGSAGAQGFSNGAGGTGGSASLGTGPIGIALSGGKGSQGGSFVNTASTLAGPSGGNSMFGGGGSGSYGTATASTGTSNTGGGGGGGGAACQVASNVQIGGGGGAGGFVDAIISAPSLTYAFFTGAPGAGGSGGTNGGAGGAGGDGIIEVTQYFN